MSDGAFWLKHYWQDSLPEAQLILDFWHVMDKLAGLAQKAIPNELTRQLWLQHQRILLPESHLDKVKQEVTESSPEFIAFKIKAFHLLSLSCWNVGNSRAALAG